MLVVAVAVLTAVQELAVVVGAMEVYQTQVLQPKELTDWAVVVAVAPVRLLLLMRPLTA
jgi:hypothetical protein